MLTLEEFKGAFEMALPLPITFFEVVHGAIVAGLLPRASYLKTLLDDVIDGVGEADTDICL